MANFDTYISETNLRGEKLVNKVLKDILESKRPYFIASDEKYEELLNEICTSFNVQKKQIYIVGSGRLGFSLKSGDDFDQKYNQTKLIKHKSDIDIAIVSKNLFIDLMKKCWKLTARYSDHDKWAYRNKNRFCVTCNHPNESLLHDERFNLNGLVCEKHIQNNQQKDILGKLKNDKLSFLQYLAIGWFRKDLAPKELDLEDIESAISKLKIEYKRHISYAVYADIEFLREFQRSSIRGYIKRKELYG